MKSQSPKIAAIYVRISDDKVGARLGVTRQIEDCERLARSRGVSRTEIYEDNDISAFSGRRRPSYERLLEDITDGRVNVVIAWHNDRLHRSPLELEQYIEISEKCDLVTYTVQAGDFDLSTPAGRMTARHLGTIARYESEHRSARIRRKTREKAEKGEYHGGAVRPFGFEIDGITHRPNEADEIRKMTRDVIDGRSLGSIIRDLNSRHVKSVRGNDWSYASLRALLLRPRNAGLRQHQGQILGQARWEPIVSREDFSRVDRKLRDPARKTTRNNTHRHLLSGIAKCGVCGKGMKSGGSKTRSGTPFKVYRCCTTRNMSKLDELVEYCLRFVLNNQAWTTPTGLGASNEEVRSKLSAVEARKEDAAIAYAAGDISMRQLTAINNDLDEQRFALEAQLVDTTPADYDYLIGMPTNWHFQETSVEAKRAIIRSLFDIRVMPVGKGSNKRGVRFIDGVEIMFLGDFMHTYTNVEEMLMAAVLNPAQVRVLRRALSGFDGWEHARPDLEMSVEP